MHRTRLLSSTLSVSSLRLIGQCVALVSGLLIASFFGASVATDDYYTALILPAALANLIINALTNLFAPIYLRHVHDNPQQGTDILSSLTFVVMISLAVATVICVIAVPLTTSIRALETDDAVTRALLFGFLLVLNCPLVGYSRLLGVYCESHQRYNIPALTAIFSTALFIVTLLLTLRWGIYSLLIANLTAAAAETLVLVIYATRKLGLRLRPTASIHPAVREMLRASFAPALTFLALFFVPTVDRLMTSTLDPGSLTAFHYGERLVVALEALVLGGPLLIIYYHWANVNAAQSIEAVAQSVPEMISLLNFIFIPLCVGGALLSYPIISILFGHGAFTAVEASAMVLAVLLLSQIFNFQIVLMVRLLVLIKQVRVQLILGIAIVVLNTALNFALIVRLGLLGIVLSTLISRIIITLASGIYLKRHIPAVSFYPVMRRLLYTMVSLLVMVGVVYLLRQTFSAVLLTVDAGLLSQIAALAIVVVFGAAVYLVTAFLIRHPDLLNLMQIVGQTRYGYILRRVGISK